jgi:hypothetical protein
VNVADLRAAVVGDEGGAAQACPELAEGWSLWR